MTKSDVGAGLLAEFEFAAWGQLVANSSTGSIYSRAEYLDALCAAAGGRFRILVARHGDLLLGGVGLYENDGPFGRFVSPRLLLYYNGPVVRDHDTKYPSERTSRDLKTLAVIEAEVRASGYGSVVLKPRPMLTDVRPFLARGWTAHHGYTYVVSITDLAEARSRIEQNLRRLIDRCGRAQITFTEDDDFESFFRLHANTMERIAFRVYLPADQFRVYFDKLARQGLIRLFHARLPGGRAIASQLVLLGHSVTHTVSAAVDAEHMKSGVSAFLRWKSFERLSELGYRANDLTDASLNPVTHFKSQLGGDLQPWVELRSPESARFRWGSRLSRLAERSRGAMGAVARRALGRAGSR
jgi:hypothetical protein